MDANLLLKIHLIGIAFWFGVVSVELILERTRAKSREAGYAAARNHYWIDLFLEIPAFLVVLTTGIFMVQTMTLSGILQIKIIAGLLAIASNAVSVIPVVLRKRAADADRLSDVIRYSRFIDLTGVVGAPAAIIALAIGFYLAN